MELNNAISSKRLAKFEIFIDEIQNKASSGYFSYVGYKECFLQLIFGNENYSTYTNVIFQKG